VVAFDLHAALAKVVLPKQVIRETEARECQEIVDQVRLVEIAAVKRELRPVERAGLLCQRHRRVETLNAIKRLRGGADFLGESLNKAPMAETDSPDDIAHCQAGICPRERVERVAHSVVVFQRRNRWAKTVFSRG
jgi:hypothetical protein